MFVSCARGDSLAWLEASWLSEQGLEVWCEDGVNPGNVAFNRIAEALMNADHAIFLLSERFFRFNDSIRALRYARTHRRSCIGIIMQPLAPEFRNAQELQGCILIERFDLAFPQYRSKLSEAIGYQLWGEPQPGTTAAPSEPDPAAGGFQLGEWRVLPDQLRIEQGDTTVALDHKAMRVLVHLAEASPHPVSSDALLDAEWQGVIVGDNAVQRVISVLRKALNDDARNPRYIETLAKTGYRLVAAPQTLP